MLWYIGSHSKLIITAMIHPINIHYFLPHLQKYPIWQLTPNRNRLICHIKNLKIKPPYQAVRHAKSIENHYIYQNKYNHQNLESSFITKIITQKSF